MAYIGNNALPFNPMQSQGKPRDAQRFSGNASTTSFTLSYRVDSSTDVEVFVDNIQQEPLVAYTAAAYTLTFTEAPPTGTSNIYVVYRNFNNDVVYSQIPDGSVTYNKLANNIRYFTTDNFTGDNSTVAFTLTETPADANTLFVSVDGVVQRAPIHYTTSANTITFTSAPPTSANVHVRHLGFRTTSEVTAVAANTTIQRPIITTPIITGNVNVGNSSNNTFFVDSVNNRVGVNTNSPNTFMTIVGNGANGLEMGWDKQAGSNNSTRIFFSTANSQMALVGIADAQGGTLNFSTGSILDNTTGTSRVRLNQYGIGVGGQTPISGTGIRFPGTNSESSDPNTLDDYEEGTFTPRTGTNITVSHARYTKIGRQVTIYGTLAHSGTITSYDNINLPFAPDNNGGVNEVRYTGGCSFFESGTGTSITNLRLLWQGNAGQACYFWGQSGGQSWTHSIAFDGTNGITQLTFTLTYVTV